VLSSRIGYMHLTRSGLIGQFAPIDSSQELDSHLGRVGLMSLPRTVFRIFLSMYHGALAACRGSLAETASCPIGGCSQFSAWRQRLASGHRAPKPDGRTPL
jgi:hypothetical protein